MKYLSLILATGAFMFCFSSALPVYCATTQDDIAAQLKASGDQTGMEVKDPRTLTMQLIRIAFGLIGTIFLGLTLYAGYLWMTAGGEEEKVTKAKTLLQQAILGLIIILMSYSITWFVVRAILYSGEPGRFQYSGMFLGY